MSKAKAPKGANPPRTAADVLVSHDKSLCALEERFSGLFNEMKLARGEIAKQRTIINALTKESNRFNAQLKIIDRNFDISRRSDKENDSNLCKAIKRLMHCENLLAPLVRERIGLSKGKKAPKRKAKR